MNLCTPASVNTGGWVVLPVFALADYEHGAQREYLHAA